MDPREEWKQRESSMPDRWTLAWWREQLDEIKKGYRGACHVINRCVAEYEDLGHRQDEVQDRCQRLSEELELTNAELGKLRAEFVEMQSRQDRMAEWIKANIPERKEGAA